MAAEQDPVAPEQERGDADAGLGRHQCPDEPKPPVAALAPGQLVDLAQRRVRHADDDELGDPHAGLDDERLARVGVVEDHPQLAAVARVDEPGRVHDRDPVLRRQARARNDEAGVTLGDRDGDACSDHRPLARPELVPLAGDEVEAGVARVGARGQHGVVAEPRDGQLDHARRPGESRDEEPGEAADVPLGQPRADQDAVLAVDPRLDRRAEGVQLRELRALGVRHEQLDHLEPVLEALGDARPQLVQPLPGPRGHLQCVRIAVLEPPAAERVDGVDLVQDELDRQLGRPDLVEHAVHRCELLGQAVLRGRGVGDVQDEVGDERLLERRREALDELRAAGGG